MTLRTLTLAFLCLFLAVTGLSGIALFGAMHGTIVQLADQRIAALSASLAPRDAPADPAAIARRIDTLSRKRDTGDLGMLLTDRDGRTIAGNVRLVRRLPTGYSGLTVHDRIAGLTQGRALTRDIGAGLRLTVLVETEPFDHYFAAQTRIYLATFAAMITVVLAGLLLFRRLIAGRIVNMRRTVDAIIDGDLERRVPVTGTGDEFDQQADGFNRMLDRIGELMAEVRNVTNDISHELRTPLARLRGELALIESRPESAPVRGEIGEAIRQVDALLALSSAILRIAEVESGRRRAGFAPIAFDALVRELLDTMEPVASESGHRLVLAQCDAAPLMGDRQLLTQMLFNLIENALRHTPPGGRIEVAVIAERDGARLIVRDDGPGIPAAAREEAMRRFGRLDRDGRSPGHGLGLPLIAAIVRLHGGTMRLEDGAPGLRVAITLAAG